MVTLPVTLCDPYPQTTPIFIFCVAFLIFIVGEHKEFGVRVDHHKSQPADDKLNCPAKGEICYYQPSNQFEVSMFTHYEYMKSNAKCRSWVVWGIRDHASHWQCHPLIESI